MGPGVWDPASGTRRQENGMDYQLHMRSVGRRPHFPIFQAAHKSTMRKSSVSAALREARCPLSPQVWVPTHQVCMVSRANAASRPASSLLKPRDEWDTILGEYEAYIEGVEKSSNCFDAKRGSPVTKHNQASSKSDSSRHSTPPSRRRNPRNASQAKNVGIKNQEAYLKKNQPFKIYQDTPFRVKVPFSQVKVDVKVQGFKHHQLSPPCPLQTS